MIPPTGRVHWLCAGLSTGSGLSRLAEQASAVTLWNCHTEKAATLAARFGLAGRIDVAAFSPEALSARLAPGDTIVCLLPVTTHPEIVCLAFAARSHYVSTSYVSPEVAALAEDMRTKGLACVVESGLDPGIDHLLAHRLVGEAESALGEGPAEIAFHSYCGGFPVAVTPFRYKFSWAPAGVLLALAAPATWIKNGGAVVAHQPWEATRLHEIGGERFEAYPNRDSRPFVAQYGMRQSWYVRDFVRGTLRLEGWKAAWQEVFAAVRDGDRGRIAALAGRLARDHSYYPDEPDRVVMSVTLSARRAGRLVWQGGYTLELRGDAGESAMARSVSQTAAIAALDVLAGRAMRGLGRAVHLKRDVARWSAALAESGIVPASAPCRVAAA
jgi:saccharopine dehydrogenase (NADP+, L-glutamate forming)